MGFRKYCSTWPCCCCCPRNETQIAISIVPSANWPLEGCDACVLLSRRECSARTKGHSQASHPAQIIIVVASTPFYSINLPHSKTTAASKMNLILELWGSIKIWFGDFALVGWSANVQWFSSNYRRSDLKLTNLYKKIYMETHISTYVHMHVLEHGRSWLPRLN